MKCLSRVEKIECETIEDFVGSLGVLPRRLNDTLERQKVRGNKKRSRTAKAARKRAKLAKKTSDECDDIDNHSDNDGDGDAPSNVATATVGAAEEEALQEQSSVEFIEGEYNDGQVPIRLVIIDSLSVFFNIFLVIFLSLAIIFKF